MPLVYIIVLNYNNWFDTIECLESLKKLNYNNFKVILIDNNSTDDSFSKLNEYLGNDKTIKELNLTFIRSTSNRGYAYGNNIGLKIALNDENFKYAWVLNNDTIVGKNSLKYLVDYYSLQRSNGTKLGLLGSKLIFYYTSNIIQCVGGKYRGFFGFPKQIGLGKNVDDINNVNEDKIDYVSGAAVFVSEDFLRVVGLMSEDYFLYFEELDWAMRGKRLNYTLGYCNLSHVYHKDGASTKKDIKKLASSPFSDFHFTRSKILFTKKFYKSRLLLIYFSFIIVVINRLRKGQFKNTSAIVNAIFGLEYVK